MNYAEKIKKIARGLWAPFNSSNAKVIFLCLCSAFIFWTFNALNKNYTTRIEQSIQFVYDQDSLISLTKLPEKVSLNVTGGGWNLLRKTLGLASDPIYINLPDPANIRYLTQYNLLNIASDQLEELNVNFVITDTIFIDIGRKVSETFAIGADSSKIDLAENYFLTSEIRVEPDSVLLTGPEKILLSLPEKVLLTIPDTKIDGVFEEDIAVNLSVPWPVSSQPEKVNISFDTQEFEAQTSQLRVAKKNFPENKNHRLTKNYADVSYLVPKDRKEMVDTAGFAVVADFNTLNTKDSTIQLIVEQSPDFLKNVKLMDPSVKVRY